MLSFRKVVSLTVLLLTALLFTGCDSKPNPEKLFNQGRNYYYGYNGCSVNKIKAIECWKKAAEEGHAPSQRKLALCYYNGDGVVQDFAESIKWARILADNGDPQFQNILGIAYEGGIGVHQDRTEAVRWFRKAAEQGNEDAIKALKKLGLEK
ncbi:MAG: sel1 repeat family protein [Thermoguttaceae bacterium]|nr:sel1 repeat family protein [Thermoguttaceae bacterium]